MKFGEFLQVKPRKLKEGKFPEIPVNFATVRNCLKLLKLYSEKYSLYIREHYEIS